VLLVLDNVDQPLGCLGHAHCSHAVQRMHKGVCGVLAAGASASRDDAGRRRTNRRNNAGQRQRLPDGLTRSGALGPPCAFPRRGLEELSHAIASCLRA
jgi:hypothetical protein